MTYLLKLVILYFAIQIIIIIVHDIVIWSMLDGFSILAWYKNNIHNHFQIYKGLASILLILFIFIIFLFVITLIFVNNFELLQFCTSPFHVKNGLHCTITWSEVLDRHLLVNDITPLLLIHTIIHRCYHIILCQCYICVFSNCIEILVTIVTLLPRLINIKNFFYFQVLEYIAKVLAHLKVRPCLQLD